MILKLTVHKEAFAVMVTGEKPFEYRRPSNWIFSRLIDKKTKRDKKITEVEITNGYGADRPVFIAKFLGYKRIVVNPLHKHYSTGFDVYVPLGYVEIQLGEIISIKNYKI